MRPGALHGICQCRPGTGLADALCFGPMNVLLRKFLFSVTPYFVTSFGCFVDMPSFSKFAEPVYGPRCLTLPDKYLL